MATHDQRYRKSSSSLPFIAFGALAVIGLSGCFGGGSSDDDDVAEDHAPSPVLVGVFTDSPVEGLAYRTETQQGTTDQDGSFSYRSGETISFHLGDLQLGSARAEERMSPLSLANGSDISSDLVTNMLVLLQSLDQDRKLNDGIQISPAIADAVSVWADSIVLDQDPASFASSAPVQSLLAELNAAQPAVFTESDPRPRKLRSAADSRAHLERSLSERRTVATRHGEVAGFSVDEQAWAWYGIPYAEPPVGDLRWKPPVAPSGWDGVLEATDWADQCAQPSYLEVYGKGSMSEDCLYLNVVVPKGFEGEKLPVMVWLHGRLRDFDRQQPVL